MNGGTRITGPYKYNVKLVIEVTADNHTQALQKADAMFRDPEFIAGLTSCGEIVDFRVIPKAAVGA